MYSDVIHRTITLSSYTRMAIILNVSVLFILNVLLLLFLSSPCSPTPFKLKIGLAFVGDMEEESMTALITAIHYPNKHWAHTLQDTDLGCWLLL